MHNVLTRGQNVFGFFTTVVAFVAGAIALISLLQTPTPPPASLELRNVQVVKGRPHYYSSKKEEYAHIKFDLDIDLSTLFRWNTKQIFLYITATYPTHYKPSSPTSAAIPDSTAIVWDAILPHPLAATHHNHYVYPGAAKKKSKKPASSSTTTSNDSRPPGIIRLTNQRPKYQITDPSGRLAARPNATLALAWNVQPWVGALTWVVEPAATAPSAALRPAWLPRALADLATWRAARGRVRTAFGFPELKDRAEAVKSAGGEGLDTAKGGEANRGKPA